MAYGLCLMAYVLWPLVDGPWLVAFGLWHLPCAYVLCTMPADLWPMVKAYAMSYASCLMVYGSWHILMPWTLVYAVTLTPSPMLVGLRLRIEVGPYPELWLTL